MNLGIFISCCVDQFSPKTAENLIRLLKNLGYEVHYPMEQTCCGKLMYENGDWKTAKQLGENFIELFKDYDYVIGISNSCESYIKNNFGRLFFNSSNHNLYKTLKNKVIDISEFLCDIDKTMSFESIFPYKVYLHTNCQSAKGYNVEKQTREILKKVKDITLLEGNYTDNFCCGYGGSFSVYNPYVSRNLAEQKIKAVLESGAEYIVSNDMSCLLHLQSYINKNNIDLKTIHLVDLLMYNK